MYFFLIKTLLLQHSSCAVELMLDYYNSNSYRCCSFQVLFSSSQHDCSHFAIATRIDFCYDFEFLLCLISFIVFYDNHFPYLNLWFSLMLIQCSSEFICAWSGNNSKWIDLVKLHVKRSMYAFFSSLFLVWYIIGLVKFIAITWKGLVPVVLSDGKIPLLLCS